MSRAEKEAFVTGHSGTTFTKVSSIISVFTLCRLIHDLCTRPWRSVPGLCSLRLLLRYILQTHNAMLTHIAGTAQSNVSDSGVGQLALGIVTVLLPTLLACWTLPWHENLPEGLRTPECYTLLLLAFACALAFWKRRASPSALTWDAAVDAQHLHPITCALEHIRCIIR
jgi:hypothetical protein